MSESNKQNLAANNGKSLVYNKKTRGADSTVNGSVFQVELLMWFLLHFHNSDDKKFKISTECKEADQLDDIVVQYEKMENNLHSKKITFMQLKYRKTQEIGEADLFDCDGYNKKKDDFALRKYFQSFCKIAKNEKFKDKSVEYIAIVTNSDFKEDIREHFEIDTAKSIFMSSDIPELTVYRLKVESGDQKFLKKVKENLMQYPALKNLADKMLLRKLEFYTPELKLFKHFLSKHILEPLPEKKGFVKFRKSFIDGSYLNDEIDYSNVITDFKGFIEKNFAGNLDTFEFEASKGFSKLIAKVISALEPEEIPFEYKPNDIEDFFKVLRIVKTPNEKDMELLIKKNLYPEEENEKDVVYSIFFKQMLDWYRNPKGELLTSRESVKWFEDIKILLAAFRREVFHYFSPQFLPPDLSP